MTVARESRLAWEDVRDKVGPMQLAVLDLIENATVALCDGQIEDTLGRSQYQPKTRRHELFKAGLIKFSHTGPSPYTNRPVKYWTRLNLQEKAERAAKGKINAGTILKASKPQRIFHDPKNKRQRTMFPIGRVACG